MARMGYQGTVTCTFCGNNLATGLIILGSLDGEIREGNVCEMCHQAAAAIHEGKIVHYTGAYGKLVRIDDYLYQHGSYLFDGRLVKKVTS